MEDALMRDILIAVEELFEKHNLSLPPEKKAELIMLLYQELSKQEEIKTETIPQ